MKKEGKYYEYYFYVLKKSLPFYELPDEVLHDMLSVFQYKKEPKGFQPFDTDSTLHNFYFLVSGRIKVYETHPETGNEYILYLLEPGQMFDLICLLDGEKHEIEMEALDTIEILVTPIENVRTWIKFYPDFNKYFLPYIAKQLREIEDKAIDLALFDTWTRTLKLFVHHINSNIHHSELRLINTFSHSELANMIGTSRNVINRHIQDLKNKDIIDVKRKHIEIKNVKKLIDSLNF